MYVYYNLIFFVILFDEVYICKYVYFLCILSLYFLFFDFYYLKIVQQYGQLEINYIVSLGYVGYEFEIG